jgi:hypothetical protein
MRALRSLIVFFPLAFLLSWYPYILGKTHFVRTSRGINPLDPARWRRGIFFVGLRIT